jgi:pyrroloquinoline quinone biosynthesis protein B
VRVRILGSAAGGGFPQWNCACPNCRGLREGTIRARPRTQASVALSADGEQWYLLGASPEIRSQLEGFPALQPRAARHTPIAAIFLTNGDLDHTLGLLSLREWSRITVYATDCVRDAFCSGNVLNRALQRFPGHSQWLSLIPGVACELSGGLTVEPVLVAGKPPLYAAPAGGDEPWTIGLKFTHAGRSLGFFPAVARIDAALQAALAGLDLLLFDGTLWSDTELIDLGLANVTGQQMAHVSVGGAAGSLAQLQSVAIGRRVYIHINNTNPILREDSPEAAAVRAAGWSVAEDGQELIL